MLTTIANKIWTHIKYGKKPLAQVIALKPTKMFYKTIRQWLSIG